MHRLIEMTDAGLHCPPGRFWIDPWRPVDRAVITHAHHDHACAGVRSYLTASEGVQLLRTRLGPDIPVRGLSYGEPLDLDGVTVALHPAGHILGSAQVRIEHRGEVVVVSGDYKRAPDPTCQPFEPLRCHVFVSEATYGLPVFRWPDVQAEIRQLEAWWAENRQSGCTSVVFAYALGKAQRLLSLLTGGMGPIYAHGAVLRHLPAYAAGGIRLPTIEHCDAGHVKKQKGAALVVAPPSAMASRWLRRLGEVRTAFASGHMLIRGQRRRRNVDRGFVVSDHADWPDLLLAARECGAEKVFLVHGHTLPLARFLRETGLDAQAVEAPAEGGSFQQVEDGAAEPGSEDIAAGGGDQV